MLKKPPTPMTALELWEKYAPDDLADLLALPDDGNEIVTTPAPLFFNPTPSLVDKMLARFYKPDQKRKPKGKGGGQFLETNAELKHQAEQLAAQAAEQSRTQYAGIQAVEATSQVQVTADTLAAQRQSKVNASTANPLTTNKPTVIEAGTATVTVKPEGTGGENDVMALHLIGLTDDEVVIEKTESYYTSYSQTYNVATVGIKVGAAMELYNFDYHGAVDTHYDEDTRMEYLEALMEGIDKAYISLATFPNTEIRLEALAAVRKAAQAEYALLWDAKAAKNTSKPNITMTTLQTTEQTAENIKKTLAWQQELEVKSKSGQYLGAALNNINSQYAQNAKNIMLWRSWLPTDHPLYQAKYEPPPVVISDTAKQIIASGKKPTQLQFLEMYSKDADAILIAAGLVPTDYEDYSDAWENMPETWVAVHPDELVTVSAQLEAAKKKLATQKDMLAKAEAAPTPNQAIIAKLKALISGGEHNISVLTTGNPPPPKPTPLYTPYPTDQDTMTTAWGKVYPKLMVDKLQDQIYKPTLHTYPDPVLEKSKWESMIEGTVQNHGIEDSVIRARQAVEYLSEYLAYSMSMGISPQNNNLLEAAARLKFYDAGLQRLLEIQGGKVAGVSPEAQYPGTTLKKEPVATYGVKKDQAKKDMQAAFEAYNAKAQGYGPEATAEAKKLYDKYAALAIKFHDAHEEYNIAAEVDPKFSYNTLVLELKSLYAGIQTPDTDLDITTHLALMEKYERIHGLKRPKLPTTYKNPMGYKKGEQQKLPLDLTVAGDGVYTKLGLVDKTGNVIDPARYDPMGATFDAADHYDMAEAFKVWRAQIHGDAETYIEDYMGSGYDSLNYALRHGEDSDVLSMVKPLDSMFAKKGATAPKNIILWRGGKLSEGDPVGSEVMPTGNFDIEQGDVLIDPGYVSTSLNRQTAQGFISGNERLFKIEVPQGLPAAYIATVGGQSETEMLLPRNSLFLHMGTEKVGHAGKEAIRLRYLGTKYDPRNPAITGYDPNTELPPGWYTPWDAEKGEWAGPRQFPGYEGGDFVAYQAGDYASQGKKKEEWIAEVWKQLEAEAKKRKKKQPVIHPGTGETLTAGMQIMFKANLTLGGKPLEDGDEPTTNGDRFKFAGFIKTGLRMPPIMPQDALRGDMSLGDQVAGAVLPFYAAASLQAPTIATFYSDDQLRGRDGRWVETGAEERSKAQRTENRHLDPNALFKKYEMDYESYDRLVRDYDEKFVNDNLHEPGRKAILAYQNGGHTFLNGMLRKGEDWTTVLTDEQLSARYDAERLEHDLERSRKLYSGDMVQQVIAEERALYISRYRTNWQYMQELYPDGITQGMDNLDEALASKGAKAPHNIKVYRGIYGDFLAEPKVGDEYTDPGYVSSSLFPERASNFGDRMNVIEVPEGTPALYLPVVSTNLGREHEVLLPRDSLLVYMGEEPYAYTTPYSIGKKKGTARRWRYLGPKPTATFSDMAEGEEPTDDGKFTWREADLRKTGKTYRIPPPRMPQDAPRSPRNADNPPTGTNLPVDDTKPLEGFSARRLLARFYSETQRRDYYGRWADEGKKKIAQAEEAKRQQEAEAKKLADQAFTAENVMAQRVGGAAGSNKGGFYKGADGVERYVKIYDDDTQAYSEILANEIYRELGVPVPQAATFEHNGILYYASTIIPGSDIGDQVGTVGLTKERADMILDGFVGDVLMANRDVLGLNFDNVIDVNGKIWRIDNGSAFLHRAQGARKDRVGLDGIGEWQSLAPGGRNQNYAQVFETAGYTSPEAMGDKLEKQLRKLKKLWESMGEGGWAAYIEKLVPGMAEQDKEAIARMLESRTRSLVDKTQTARFYRRDQRRDYYGKWVDEGRARVRAGESAGSYTSTVDPGTKLAAKAATIAPTTPSTVPPPAPMLDIPGTRSAGEGESLAVPAGTGPTLGDTKDKSLKALIEMIVSVDTMLPEAAEGYMGLKEKHVWRKAITELELKGTPEAKRHADGIRDVLAGLETGASMRERQIREGTWDFEAEATHIRESFQALPEQERRRLVAGVESLAADAMQPHLNPFTMEQLDKRRMDGRSPVGIEDLAARHHMMVPEYVEAAVANLKMVVDQSTLSKRTHLSTLKKVLADKRVKTQYETGASSGSYYPEARSAAEYDMFNYPTRYVFENGGFVTKNEDVPDPLSDPNVKKRPVYGYLVTRADQYRTSGGYEGVDSYGDVDLVLKDSVRERSTFVGQDSLGLTQGDGKLSNWANVLPAPVSEPNLRVLDWEENDPLELDFIEGVSGTPYTEIQVHGGVTLEDIEYVVLPKEPDDQLRKALEKHRLPWILADQGDDIPELPDGMTFKEYTLSRVRASVEATETPDERATRLWRTAKKEAAEAEVEDRKEREAEYAELEKEAKSRLAASKRAYKKREEARTAPTLKEEREAREARMEADLAEIAARREAEAKVWYEGRMKDKATSMEGTFSIREDGDTVRTENTAFFYRVDQRRDRGRFADEGRGRRPGMKRPPAAQPTSGQATGNAPATGQRQPLSLPSMGSQKGLVQPGQSLVDKSDMPNLERKGVRTAGMTDAKTRRQIVELTRMGVCDTPYNMDCMQAMAGKHGFPELAEQLGGMTRASWFTTLVDTAPDLEQALGIEYSEDRKRVSVNLGITPYRGKPATEPEETSAYYNSTRYTGWLTDLRMTAKQYDVKIEDVVKVTGVWQGSLEPSASVWLNGDSDAVKEMAKAMGAEYNQEGVMVFSQDEDDGVGALYTMPGITDRKKAIEAMQQSGVDGARLVQGRDGTYALEVADFDGSMHDKVVSLSKRVGTETFYTPGKASLLFGGTDYRRRTHPHKGRGTTYASKGAAA